MAQGRDEIIIDVLGNTKPLEKSIAKSANQALTLNTKGFSQPLGKISGQLGEFEKSLAASNARVIAFGASAGAIYAIQKAFNATIKSVIDVEKSLADINVILNVSQKSLNTFGNRLFDIAKNTGLAFSDVAKAATEFSRQGLGIEDTLKRTSDALILTRLSGLDTVSSVEALTAAINSFSSSALTSTQIVNKLAAVDASFAVSSADLAEAIKRVGSSADDVGVTFDQLISLVTSAQQITARGGSVIGNSFKTIFTRLQRPKTLEALEQIGVATRDQEGNILPLIQILNSLSQAYDKLGSVQKAQLAETIGGVFQINVLKASLGDLSKEYSIYSRALQISTGATDEASRRNEALNETLAATVNKTVVNLQNAATDIGNLAIAPALQKALGGLNYILENFGTDESEGVGAKIGEGLAKGIGNFLSGPGLLLGVASLLKIFERLTVFTADAFKQLTGLNTQTAEQRSLQVQILNLIGKNPQIIDQINNGSLNTASLHKEILNLIEQETVAMQRQIGVADSLTKSLMAAGVRVAQTGPMKGAAIKPKAFGFIPNFNASQEVMGALAGGYAPGQIKSTFIPNYGKVTYNSAEKVKKFSGMSQPAIMPPSSSSAGKSYKKNFQAAHGFNPYANRGFIPNFAALEDIILPGFGDKVGVLLATGGSGPRDYTQPASEIPQLKDEKFKGKRIVLTNIPTRGVIPLPGSGLQDAEAKFDQLLSPLLYDGLQAFSEKIGKIILGKNPTSKPKGGNVYSALQRGTKGDIFESAVRGALTSGNLAGGAGQGAFDFNPGSPAQEELVKFMGLNLGPDARIESKIGESAAENIPSKVVRTFPAEVGTALETFINVRKQNRRARTKPLYAQNRKDRQFSSGFIPNFSPISQAFATEESLGGNPVLDYQSGVGLYVRDRKTQPNFAAVKRDHPEGLSTAMSNSYAMQKSMAAFGFIPNFATLTKKEMSASASLAQAITGDTPLRKLYQEIAQTTEVQSKTKFDLEKYREKLIFASFGLSIAGSFFSELAGDNEILSKNINSLSQGISTSLTAVQLIPGPIGLFVGGLGIAYSVINGLVKTLRYNGENIAQSLEKIKEQSTSFSNSTSTYSQALQKLTEAYTDAKTPTETIVKLNQDLAKAAMDLPDKYRLQLLAITDNVTLQEEMNKIQGKLAKEQKNLEFATAVNTKIAEGGIFGPPQVFKTAGATKAGAKEIFGGLSDEGQIKFLKNLNTELFKLDQPELIKYLEKFYGLNSGIVDVLSRLGEQEFKNISTALLLFGQGLKNANEEFKQTDQIIKDQIKTQTQLKKETQRAKTALDGLNASLIDLINTSIRSQSFKQTFGEIQSANLRGAKLSRAESLLGYEELFRSPESINSSRTGIDILTKKEEFAAQARELQSGARQGILETGAELLQFLRKPDQEEPQSRFAIQAFESGLESLSKQNLSSTETGKRLNDLINDTFGTNLDKSLEVQSKIQDIMRNQNEKLALIGEEQKKSNSIALSNLDIQQRILQARRDIETFGGIKGFIDPESLSSSFENFSKSLNLYRSGRGQIERGRGAAGLISETLGLAGGGFRGDLGTNFKGLRSSAISGRASELRNQTRQLSVGAPSAVRNVLTDISRRSVEIATAQVDNLLKNENIGQNVEEIAGILKKVNLEQNATIMPKLNESIITATTAIQTDLTPAMDELRGAIYKAASVFEEREKYQTLGEQLGLQNITKAGAERRLVESKEQMQLITPELQKTLGALFPRANLYDFAGGNDAVIEQEKLAREKLTEALKTQQPISLKSLGLSDKANTQFGQLLDQYNQQISTMEVSRAAIDSSTKALGELNSKVADTAGRLILLGQNITPVGTLAEPQNIQGAIDLKIPNNLLELNVGGRISFDGGNVQVTISPDSDLTTLVTPIVNNFMSQAKLDIENEFNAQINKIREDAGLRRLPIPLGK